MKVFIEGGIKANCMLYGDNGSKIDLSIAFHKFLSEKLNLVPATESSNCILA